MTSTSSLAYRVVHRTTYRYASPMIDGYTVATVLPRDTPHQRVLEAHVAVSPFPDRREDGLDAFGNNVQRFGVHQPHDELVVEARSVVEVVSPGDFTGDDESWELVTQRIAGLRGDDALDVAPFRGRSTFVDLDVLRPQLAAIASESFTAGRGVVDATAELCERIHTGFAFDPAFTELSTPLAEVLTARRGVCQDFAHLATGCLRSIGLAARYVSGYIETEPAPGYERLVGADASHAWCSVWTPTVGWVDFDPTNGQLPVHRHVTVAWGRDYADVTPVRGVVIGPAADQTLDVSVDVSPV